MFKSTFFLIALLFSIKGNAQLIPQISDIPDYLNARQKELFATRKTLVTEQKASLKTRVDQFNTRCGNVPESNTSLMNQCEEDQDQIRKDKILLIVAIKDFNNAILSESDNFFAIKEQKNLTEKFDVWISNQQAKVQEAAKADSNWTNEFMNYLKGFSPPDSTFQPKGLMDLKNGDVLLLFPVTIKDKIIDWADKFYNSYSQDENLKADHGLVFIGRDPGGRCLFLNNTAKSYLHSKESPGGPHIISQSAFEKLYGQNDYFVARPRAVVDGKKLFLAAQGMHLKASKNISLTGSSYGVLGNDMVCTGSSDMAVARSTGRKIIDKKKFIDVSPNNFFDKQDVGRYYIISPLVKQK